MSKTYPHFCFDMDGTVIDTSDHFETACLTACENHSIGLTRDAFREMFGSGMRTHEWMGALGIHDQSIIASVIHQRDEIMIALLETQTTWLPGAPEMLDTLRSRQMHVPIVTNAQNKFIQAVRRCLPEIDSLVTEIVGPETYGMKPKPEPGNVLRAWELSGREKSEFIYSGDQLFDLRAARNAGVGFCAYHGEHTHPDALAEADHCVTHLPQVLDITLG